MTTQSKPERSEDQVIEALERACSEVTDSVAVINAIVQTEDGGQQAKIGTAFCIDSRGYFVTALHVVKGQISSFIVPIEGTLLQTEVVAVDDKCDLALVKAHAQEGSFKPVKFADSPPVDGEFVGGLGYPDQGLLIDLSVYLARHVEQVGEVVVDGHTLASALRFIAGPGELAGYSGGPIVNEHAQVVAATISADNEVGLVIGSPAADIASFVKLHLPA